MIHKRIAKRASRINGELVPPGPRYDVRLRDRQGRTYTTTFRTKREAEAFEDQERTDQRRGAWVDPRHQALTFGELADRWLEANPAKRGSSYARDESIVRVHLKPALGETAIGLVSKPDVQALVNEWSTRMKPRTVRRMYGVLRAVLAYAVDSDYLGRSPCRGIKLPEVGAIVRHVVDADELAALVAALGPDYGLMSVLGVVLGLRWGEVAGVRVCDVDVLRRAVTVTEQVTRGRKGATVTGPPKSEAGRRTLALDDELVELLAAHMARRGLTAADAGAHLFAAPAGGPLEYSHWRHRVWLPACLEAGLGRMEKRRYTGLQFHDLRRANATAMALDGVDEKTAQTRLGHTDIRLTLGLYAQATSEGDQRAAERLSGRFLRPLDDRVPRANS